MPSGMLNRLSRARESLFYGRDQRSGASITHSARPESHTLLNGGMTDVLQMILLLATLIWSVVKIAQAIKDFHED